MLGRLIARVAPCNLLAAALVLSVPAFGAEVVVQNDNLQDGQAVGICPCFVQGEEAAAWLTSPCDGYIVAVQIFWSAQIPGTNPPSLEDSIIIYNAGTFPTPGAVLTNATQPPVPAVLVGPVMQDGGLNEFRHLDEVGAVPLRVPVSKGQTFVVSLRFWNPNAQQFTLPSVAWDCNSVLPPCAGQCQQGRNAIAAAGLGWINGCAAGMNGDWIIRAVVDCQSASDTGACCLPNGSCVGDISQADCTAQGGTYRGNGTVCDADSCKGACCVPTTGNCVFTTVSNCAAANGVFQGFGVTCDSAACFGACCLPDGNCLNAVTSQQCAAAGGVFQGGGTDCASANCPQPLGACCLGDICLSDLLQADCEIGFGGVWQGANSTCSPVDPCAAASCPADVAPPPGGDGVVNVDDLLAVISNWGPCAACSADVDGDGMVNVDDLLAVISSWGPCQ